MDRQVGCSRSPGLTEGGIDGCDARDHEAGKMDPLALSFSSTFNHGSFHRFPDAEHNCIKFHGPDQYPAGNGGLRYE